jgi:transcriptional regulator with XRE-family HTH domain
MATAVQTPSLAEELRRRVEACPSKRKLARDSGVDLPTISRFRRGARELKLSTVDRLCAALGLHLAGGE